jgi:hypothetical protein
MNFTKHLNPSKSQKNIYLAAQPSCLNNQLHNYTTWVQILVNDMHNAEFQQAKKMHNAIKKYWQRIVPKRFVK